MKIYILWMKEVYEEPVLVGLFTSEDKAIKYRNDMIDEYHSLYEVNDFKIECRGVDFDVF